MLKSEHNQIKYMITICMYKHLAHSILHRWIANHCQYTHVHPWQPHPKDYYCRHCCPHCSGHNWVPAWKWYTTTKLWV